MSRLAERRHARLGVPPHHGSGPRGWSGSHRRRTARPCRRRSAALRKVLGIAGHVGRGPAWWGVAPRTSPAGRGARPRARRIPGRQVSRTTCRWATSRCGSPASSGFPLAVRLPATAQLWSRASRETPAAADRWSRDGSGRPARRVAAPRPSCSRGSTRAARSPRRTAPGRRGWQARDEQLVLDGWRASPR